jgi:hypothetical protein
MGDTKETHRITHSFLGSSGTASPAWAGDHDRAFTDARLAEIRQLAAARH